MIKAGDDSVRAWVVYPERATKAPVVVVVHEIFGLSTWVRAVADQLAADGFIAVAPDLLTGYPVAGNADSVDVQAAVAQVSRLDAAQVQRRDRRRGAVRDGPAGRGRALRGGGLLLGRVGELPARGVRRAEQHAGLRRVGGVLRRRPGARPNSLWPRRPSSACSAATTRG
jgi:hypothetical protein